MKKGSTFLLFVLVMVLACGGLIFAHAQNERAQVRDKEAQATEAPREVVGLAVAQTEQTSVPDTAPTKTPAENAEQTPTKTPTESRESASTQMPSVGQTPAPIKVPSPSQSPAPTKTPAASQGEVPTKAPDTSQGVPSTKAPAAKPTTAPTPIPTPEEEIAGVSRSEITATAEFLGIPEAEVELVLRTAEEKGQVIDVAAIESGEMDIKELWGLVTEALGQKKAYELLLKALGSNLF